MLPAGSGGRVGALRPTRVASTRAFGGPAAAGDANARPAAKRVT